VAQAFAVQRLAQRQRFMAHGWDHDFKSCRMVAAETEMKMAVTPHRRSARKQGQRFMEAARARRLLNLKKRKEPFIAASVLQALADSNLPNSLAAYNLRLAQLELPSS
jgi:hypothetical protein